MPDYRVIDAVDLPCGVRRVWACGRGTFGESTTQVPTSARSTVRLKDALVGAVICSGRSARETAVAHSVSWWLVQSAISAVAVLLAPVDLEVVRWLGIDEHRYRSVRWFREPDGARRRSEPWMTTFVVLNTGAVLGVVGGRDSAGVGAWLTARTPAWREQVAVVAIDPSAAFRRAIATHLPGAAVSVDAFHLVAPGNQMLTAVRQRRAREVHDRRGRARDPAWANRCLLLRAADTLSSRGWDRLAHVFDLDDPIGQLDWASDVKEHPCIRLKTTSLDDAADTMQTLHAVATVADMPETDRLMAPLEA